MVCFPWLVCEYEQELALGAVWVLVSALQAVGGGSAGGHPFFPGPHRSPACHVLSRIGLRPLPGLSVSSKGCVHNRGHFPHLHSS